MPRTRQNDAGLQVEYQGRAEMKSDLFFFFYTAGDENEERRVTLASRMRRWMGEGEEKGSRPEVESCVAGCFMLKCTRALARCEKEIAFS